MIKRTICRKLKTIPLVEEELKETSKSFADACNDILKQAIETGKHRAYTSQTCHQCLYLGSRKGECFTCLTCGKQDADLNASHVIAIGGVACKPARISSAS